MKKAGLPKQERKLLFYFWAIIFAQGGLQQVSERSEVLGARRLGCETLQGAQPALKRRFLSRSWRRVVMAPA